MKKLLKALRLAAYVLFLFMAAFAVGLTGHFLPITREQYQNKRIATEQVDKKREDEEPEKED